MADVQDSNLLMCVALKAGNREMVNNFVANSSKEDVEECRRYAVESNSTLALTCGVYECELYEGDSWGHCGCYFKGLVLWCIMEDCDMDCGIKGHLTYGVYNSRTQICVSCIRKTRIEKEETANIKPARR